MFLFQEKEPIDAKCSPGTFPGKEKILNKILLLFVKNYTFQNQARGSLWLEGQHLVLGISQTHLSLNSSSITFWLFVMNKCLCFSKLQFSHLHSGGDNVPILIMLSV